MTMTNMRYIAEMGERIEHSDDEKRADAILADLAWYVSAHGLTADNIYNFEYEFSNRKKIIVRFRYEFLLPNYRAIKDYKCIITPTLTGVIDIRLLGANKFGIKNKLELIIADWLKSEVASEPCALHKNELEYNKNNPE